MRTYKTLDKDLDNYEKHLHDYQNKMKQANKEKRQRIINDIGTKFLDESDINIDDVHYVNNILKNYSFIDKNRMNKYHQDMSNYGTILKLLKNFASNMYTTNEGNHYINQNDLPQLSTWLYTNFRSSNEDNNQVNDNGHTNNENNDYEQ